MIRPMAKLIGLLLWTAGSALTQQIADPNFSTRIEHPAFTNNHPRVGIDEGHRNFHTREGRYRPLAALLESDGFAVSSVSSFKADSLKKLDILVIANALGKQQDGVMGAAFTPAECDAVRDWVHAGGSLLLIADHAPFGDAANPLAQRFGVEMGKGWALDQQHSTGNPSFLVFSDENHLLGDHAIVRGRNQAEQVRKVVAFTGQSLSVPTGATQLMKFSGDALEAITPDDAQKIVAGQAAGKRIEGRAQGLAMPFERGRIAMFGEAAMFSAQVATLEGQSMKMGMNVPGNDDRQFALNVMHWLAHLID